MDILLSRLLPLHMMLGQVQASVINLRYAATVAQPQRSFMRSEVTAKQVAGTHISLDLRSKLVPMAPNDACKYYVYPAHALILLCSKFRKW